MKTTLSFKGLSTTDLTVMVTDLSGKLIRTYDHGVVNGALNLPINVENTSPGTYLVRISANGEYVIKRIVLMDK